MISLPIEPHFIRMHKLGTRKIDELGQMTRYAKIDFGIVGKDTDTGKQYRDACYAWIPVRL